MSQQIIRCNAVQSAYVSSIYTDTNYSTQSTLKLSEGLYSADRHDQKAFLSFEPCPQINKKRATATFKSYSKGVGTAPRLDVRILKNSFNENTVTWNNCPDSIYAPVYASVTSSYAWRETNASSGMPEPEKKIDLILRNGVVVYMSSTYNNATGEVYSTRSSNIPYLNITCNDVVPFASNHIPSKFLDKKVDNTFKWDFNYDHTNVYGTLKQASAKLRYRNKGATTYTEVLINGDINTYTIPANTFTANTVEWQVIVTSDDGIESIQSDWVTLTTIDSMPSCEIIRPQSVVIDGMQENTFEWEHIIDTSSPQTKFDLQYNQNNLWVDVISETSAIQSCVIAPQTLPAGNLQWRVRTYNTDDVASEWSAPVSIIVRSAPFKPTYSSISNQARPLIQWQSVGQQGIEIEVLNSEGVVYQTGIIATTLKSYRVPVYLDNGEYTFRLRITNSYNLKSEWATSNVMISSIKPFEPVITVETVDNGVKIKVASELPKLYLLRDGIPIAKISNEYIDYRCVGNHSYKVRGVDANDNFADSNEMIANVMIKNATLALASSPDIMLELRLSRGNPVVRTGRIAVEAVTNYYAGREYGVTEFSEHTDESRSLVFSFTDSNHYELLKTMMKQRQTLIFRTKHGECLYGTIHSSSFQADKYTTDFETTIMICDYVDKIEYEVGI